MEFLADEVRELYQESWRHSRRIDQVAHRVDSFLEYSTTFNSALAQMFINYGFNSGPSQVQFPAPPMFPEYTFDSADDEDVDDPN